MRVKVETYDEFKLKAVGSDVYYSWDPKLEVENPEAPLFYCRVMLKGVVLEFWSEEKPPTFDQDFPAAVLGTMEE